MEFSARTRSLQRSLVLFALVAAGVVFSTNTMSTFSVPKAVLVIAAGTLVVILGAARTAVAGEARVRYPVLLGVAGAFVLLAIVATILSDSPVLSLAGEYDRQTGLVAYAAYVALFATTVAAFDVDRVQQIAVAILGTASAAAVYGLLQALDLDPLQFTGMSAEGVFATLGNPNWAAAYTGMAVPVAAWIVLSGRWPSWARVTAGALAVLNLAVSAVTSSAQGPLVAAAGLGVVAIGWCLGKGGRWRTRLAPAVTGAGVIGAVVIGLGVFAMGPLARIHAEPSIVFRKYYWQPAWQMFVERPLTGVGFDLYGSHFLLYRPAAMKASRPYLSVDAPHSVPLDMLASGGVLLGVAYLAFVAATGWLLVRGLLRHDGERLLLLAGVGGAWLGYQAQSLISVDVPSLAVTHWVLAGAVAVVAGGHSPRTMSLPWRPSDGTRTRRSRRLAWLLTGGSAAAVLLLAAQAWTADVAARDAEQLRLRGEAVTAVERAATATSRAPWRPEYWEVLGRALHAAGGPDAALAAYDRAGRLDPRAAEPHLGAARAYAALGDHDAAWREYERGIELIDGIPTALVEAGRYLMERGNYDRAVPLLEQAVEADPDDARFHLFLGQALAGVGEGDAARSSVETALALATDDRPGPADAQVEEAARALLDELGRATD